MLPGWILGLIVCTTAGSIGIAAIIADAQNDPLPVPLTVGLLLFVLPLTLNFCVMYTRVSKGEVFVRFGWLAPFYWKRIPLHDVRAHSAITYRPLRDAGGWGIRFGRFEGRATTFLNMRGNEGVLLDMAKRPYIIGSQDPRAFVKAIDRAR